MIDVSQWRASIGLWNHCQAASSRPANGRHSHSFKAVVDSKSGSITSGEKKSKLPAALSLIALLLFLFHSFSVLRHILMIPPTGNCYQVQCTTGVTVTDTNYLQSVVLPGGSSSNLIYNDLYLIVCLRMLLLLSGDVECNPGPTIGNPMDILTNHFGKLIDAVSGDSLKLANELYAAGLIPQQTEKDALDKLVNVIEQQLESSLNPEQYLIDICHVLINQQNRTLTNVATSILHQLGQPTPDNVSSPTILPSNTANISADKGCSAKNIGIEETDFSIAAVSGQNPASIAQKHTLGREKELDIAAVTKIFCSSDHHYMLIGTGLKVKTADLMPIPGAADNNLILVFQRWFDADRDVNWDTLIKLCDDFPDKLGKAKSNLLAYIGQSIPDNVSLLPSPVDDNTPITDIKGQSDVAKPISSIPDYVQGHAENMRQYYKHEPTLLSSPVDDVSNTPVSDITGQCNVAVPIPDDVQVYAKKMRQQYRDQPIVAIEWPPQIEKESYFGRLALVKKNDPGSTQTKSDLHHIDDIFKQGNKIEVEDVLRPTDSSLSLRVIIDGPPGIGKTTLCRKLLNMWSNGDKTFKQYDLVLYCPLRNSKIAKATTLADLFEYESSKVPKVADWFWDRDGEGLLIIFDGWDELSEQLRQSSLAASIIYRKKLDQCSVIVTSRSYASSSLSKMDTLSNHVQVIGFSKEEISTVIIQTLQKDARLAQELIDENTEQRTDDKCSEQDTDDDTEEAETDKKTKIKYKSHFTTTQISKDSQLAVKLINDLKVRNDVQSLCYVPLVCSMVILVYCKEGGHLPTTLTQLYENFILQTIRRHVEIKARHNIDPYDLDSLSSLPSQLDKPLQEMCQLAYTSLANATMAFSSHQLQSLSEAVKEDYLGLITTFIEYDKKKYQFLHLSIQEFLAAWWIAKHEEKKEEVFKDHYDDPHFRMCLSFVAGLTHLEHENYQQYFNKQLQLQCQRKPLLNTYLPCFYQNPLIRQTVRVVETFHIYYEFENVPILLLQLLYESQNKALCQVLAQSMNKNSLCLYKQRVSTLSLFDWLCLSFFINNSKIEWDHLHLGVVPDEALSVFTDALANSLPETKCKRLELWLHEPNARLINKILEPSLFYNIHECYFELFKGTYVPCLVLLQFLNLPQLKILHLIMEHPDMPTVDNTYFIEKCTELEKCIAEVKLLKEMNVNYRGTEEIKTLASVISGVKQNKTITSLSLSVSVHQKVSPPPPLLDRVIEQLLRDNSTLHALSLNIPDELIPSLLNIVDVNTPLTALELEIGEGNSKLLVPLLPHIKKLDCLILHKPYPWPRLLFLCHPSLNTLNLPLDTAESAIELFTILQTNTTLETLNVEIKEERVYTSSMGTSLQDMLTQNQTLKYFEINNDIPSSFLSFLTTGLRYNTSIKHLNVFIPLNTGVTFFLEAISKNDNLKEINLNFTLELDQSHSCSEEQIMTPLFYEHLLPAVTSMLQSQTAIIELRIGCAHINGDWSEPHWIELVKELYNTIFVHPSLEYIEFNKNRTDQFTRRPLEDTLKDQKTTLIERRKNEQPGKPLPIVDFNLIKLND